MTTESPMMTVVLDPATVQVNPANARKKLRDIDQLADSMRRCGVLVPVLVTSVDGNGSYMIVAGHRRRAAAIKAGVSLPAIVTTPEAAEEALWMLTENEARDDFDTAERARAFQTAMDLGVSAEVVREYTGVSEDDMAALSAVSGSKVAKAATERRDLTLEEAAVIAEFDDDKEAVRDLLAQIENGGLMAWRVESLRRERVERKALAEKLRPYLDAKVRVLTDTDLSQTSTKFDQRAHPRAPIAELLTDKGKSLTPAGHKNCPGRTVAIFSWAYGERKVTEFCEDPDAHGHQRKAKPAAGAAKGGREPTAKEQEKLKAEQREVRENNKAMDIANTVRRRHLTELFARTVVPKGTERFVTAYLLAATWQPHPSTASLALVTGRENEAGIRGAIVAGYPENRAIMAGVVYVAAAIEGRIDKTTWRRVDQEMVSYLRYLEGTGYVLSDVEAAACAKWAKAVGK